MVLEMSTAAGVQLVAPANKKAEEAKGEKFEDEEIETIGKKGTEVELFILK